MFCQVDDNIPLRVMLLLMDEVFDLKERNQWLRRNIKNLLQQLIRATYGDTINRYHIFLLFVYLELILLSFKTFTCGNKIAPPL